MKTIWKPIKGYEGLYEVSNKGEVKSSRNNKILSPRLRYRYNYKSVAVLLHKENVPKETQISRLVAQAFIPNPDNKPFVNHIDNNATNNVYTNLEWVSREENIEHAKKQGRLKNGSSYPVKIGLNFLRNKEKLLKVK